MADYKVRISASAEQDLLSIMRYISETLREPAAAERIYAALKEKIMPLQQMPDRYAVVRDEQFARMGLRKLFVENYTVFYVIDEDTGTVQVVRVLYNRREWQDVL